MIGGLCVPNNQGLLNLTVGAAAGHHSSGWGFCLLACYNQEPVKIRVSLNPTWEMASLSLLVGLQLCPKADACHPSVIAL